MQPVKIIRATDQQRRDINKVLEGLNTAIRQSDSKEDIAVKLWNDHCERELSRLITADPGMLELKRKVRLLCAQDDPVLITGPSGTGKEIIARALHGYRPAGRFFAVNCAAMPEALIESELFGHVAGSFTGAIKDRIGILQSAHGGTVFLDEIGEAPLALQAKLLRVLQPDKDGKQWIRPVGSTEYIAINTRIVAATKMDLYGAIATKQFREDLYGRLMTFELYTTPLSERTNDIPLILHHFHVTLEQQSEIYSAYWQERIAQFNVRALQAFARRQQVIPPAAGPGA